MNKYNLLYTADIQEDKGIFHVTTKAIYNCGLLHSDLGETLIRQIFGPLEKLRGYLENSFQAS